LKLEDIYFDKSIRDYALKLTKNKEEADELVSIAFDICSQKPFKENLKGFFAMVMRNQWLKKCNKKDPYFFNESYEDTEVEEVLSNMSHYHSNILRAVSNGENLTQIHKGASIGYKTLKADYKKAKKEFKIMYEKNIKVAIVTQSISAVSYHRLIVPLVKMSKDYGIEVVCLMNDKDDFLQKLDGVTHVLYNRNISALMKPEETILLLKAKGIKVICDIDDYWILPKGHPTKLYYSKSKMDKCIVANIKHADQVWTTTKLLAEKITPYNKNVEVIKNAIDPLEEQFAYDNLSIDFDTFFYSGGHSHLQDLKLLGDTFDNEEFYIKAPSVPRKMKGIRQQISSITEYAKDYVDCGICLIPLKDNVFNSCKSELKMIEAGHFVKPVVVSAVEPYTLLATNKNSLKVYNNDWAAAVKKIKGNHNMQIDLALKLKEDVSSKYDIVKENAKRLQTL
jgi:glycosyltransferase involved in cell wall biosynthesis|tara:strand:- start:1447 stop:2799 length:1353 start_codon:yes stop_codon:yes gene_type:complete